MAVAAACSRAGRTADAPVQPEPPDSAYLAWVAAHPVIVEVENNYEIPMQVFASGSGIYYRMGIVAQGQRGTFTLRQALTLGGMVEFVTQPTGYGPQISGGQLYVAPGDTVDFVIATLLQGTLAIVRP